MSAIFGILGLQDSDASYVKTIGQTVVYDAYQQLLGNHNEDIAQALGVFVEGVTEGYSMRYKLPGGGYMQEANRQGTIGAVKAVGSWDVAFPIRDFRDALGEDDISLAYMTMQELDRHIDTITIRDLNTRRRQILKALLDNTAQTWLDPIHGSLTIQALANGDTVVYPPVLGSDTEATDNHYLESGYLSAAISDTNNPLVTIRGELEEHFGVSSGGENLVAFINNAETGVIEALTDFDPVNDRFTQPGANTAELVGLPANLPGRVIGRSNGVWVVEWRWMPANYIFGLHLDAPKPLMMRVDPAATGLGQGLQLVSYNSEFPLDHATYRNRYGFGVANRLNGVVMELGNGGGYTVPTGYSK